MSDRSCFGLIAVIVVSGLLLSACRVPSVGSSDAAEASTTDEALGDSEQPRGVLSLSHGLGWGGNESVDPASNSPYAHIAMLVYDGLTSLDSSNRPIPALATSWEQSDQARVWTFQLRSDVLFHDQSQFTADDVKFTFERIIAAGVESPLEPVLRTLDSVTAVDEFSVSFRLAAPSPDFPLLLADRRMRILSAEGEIGVGTGPFSIDIYDPKNTTRLVAFDEYWQGRPRLSAIESIALPDRSSRLEALASGAVDLLDELTPEEASRFENRNDFGLQSVRSGDWRGIVFRTDTEPYSDVRVRTALRMVADRQEMVELVGGGSSGATVACDSPVWSMDQYHQEVDCPPNVQRARELLADAGYADGLTIEITTSTLDSYWLPMLELYQHQAAEAGVTVEIVMAPAESYWSEVWLVEPAVTTQWAERNAQQILSEAFTSQAVWNETYWQSLPFDSLLAEASTTVNDARRSELYGQAQQMIRDDGGSLIPFHINRQRVVSDAVTGVPPIGQFRVPWHEAAVG